jgi:hypothetical protein
MRFPHCLKPEPAMIEIWNRLSPEKQAALLERFGSEENALAALVTTQLVAPAKS